MSVCVIHAVRMLLFVLLLLWWVQVKLLRDGAPTCFEEDDLVVLTEVHEAGDPLGELHHVLDGVGEVDRTVLPHPLSGLETGERQTTRVHHLFCQPTHTYTVPKNPTRDSVVLK